MNGTLALFIFILLIIIGCLVFLLIKFYLQNNQLRNAYQSLNDQMQRRVEELFGNWCARERDSICEQQRGIALREAEVQLEQWIFQSEKGIRIDAVQRSQSVIIGKVTEHLFPYLPEFPFNPKDVRFLGAPVDLIIFDGMNNGNIENIIFAEVKTGSSALSTRERQIRNVINDKRVVWTELRIDRH